MTRYLIGLGLVLSVVAGAYVTGRSHGFSAAETRHTAARLEMQERLHQAAQQLSMKERERLAALRQLDAIQRENQNDARQDPNADRPALGLDSVRRLNRL